MLALDRNLPQQMTLLEILRAFLVFREEVVTRRTRYYLKKARARTHLLVGLLVAVLNIDEVVALIRAAPDPAAAKEALLARSWSLDVIGPFLNLLGAGENQISDGKYQLSEDQAKAILELKLQRLTGLERGKLESEYKSLVEDIKHYIELLSSRPHLMALIK
jgi:DNA gyrase subunit A